MSFRESDYGFDAGRINGIWQSRAQCRDVHPETMWPLISSTTLVSEARLVCVGCPVRIPCLQDGIAAGDWESVRGGLTGSERRKQYRMGVLLECYPQWRPPTRDKTCHRCGNLFVANQRTSRRGMAICPECMRAPCTGCGTTEFGRRRVGRCDNCYAVALRRARQVAGC